MRIFRPLHVSERLDLLAIPAAHLRAGIAARNIVDVVIVEKLAQQIHAAAFPHPGRLLATVQTERNRCIEGKSRVLVDEVIPRRMTAIDRAILDRIEHTEARHEFTCGKNLYLEFAARCCLDMLCHHFGRRKNRIQALRET